MFGAKTINMRFFLVLPFSFFIFLFVGQTLGDTLSCSRQNEIQDCVKVCPPEKTCDTKDIQFNCLVNNKRCQIKCICKQGFYRNYNGDCVSSETCDRCPGSNEIFSCGSACDTTCATLNQPCPIVNIRCNDKCYCRNGYARNNNNICIPISQFCGENEEYQECKKTCPPDTCMSLVAKFKCASNPPCVPGCVCKPYFLRVTPDSPCIPMRQCPQLAHSPDFN